MPRSISRRFRLAALVFPLLTFTGCKSVTVLSDINGDAPCEVPASLDALPRVSHDTSMMALAHDLDHLEKHIDLFGSVTAKAPDVWGQQRLTKYRYEIEQELAKDLSGFDVKLAGSLARTDQSFFVSATTLAIAAGGKPPAEIVAAPTEGLFAFAHPVVKPDPDPAKKTDPAPKPEAKPPEDLSVAAGGGKPSSVLPTPKPARQDIVSANLSLKPEELLAQKVRYLNFLSQLRRNNEGDDTADSPGFSLNLIRIPVSLLPGKRTDTGYGAEATFTVNPVISDELLPSTFRNLVISDLTEQLGLPLTKLLEGGDNDSRFSEDNRWIARYFGPLEAYEAALDKNSSEAEKRLSELPKRVQEIIGASEAVMSPDIMNLKAEGKPAYREVQVAKVQSVRKRVARFINPVAKIGVPFSTGTRNRQAIPFSQYIEVHGAAFTFEIAFQANQALGRTIRAQGYAHLPDVQAFLQTELDAAMRLLREPRNAVLWAEFCTPDTVNLVRSRNSAGLIQLRERFRERMLELSGEDPSETKDLTRQNRFSSTAALAYVTLIHSALLNDRLVLDIKESCAAKGAVPPETGAWPDFYLPVPSAEARRAFADYVRIRWPIKVFALDPANDEQNIADTLTTRRETQLALAVALTSGQINVRQFNRFARQIESQYETIDLNRVQVGFSHGENVFGWRFYPRFQTPPTPSNATVILRDQLLGGPNREQLLRERKLEPGIRECVALVIMPAFVPNVTIDVTTNWFGLTNPKHKEFDHSQAMKLSRTVRAITTEGCKVSDAHLYREGDQGRLLKRAEQLSARLPMQTLAAQVPVETNLGGFDLFVHGTSDLAPQLYGFYGAPGVIEGRDNTLFLVGNHFSVTQSRVIVGNREIAPECVKMISRQVMQVRIPIGLTPFLDEDKKRVVNVHIATPYGVSGEVSVPLLDPVIPASVAVGPTFPTEATTTYEKAGINMEGKYTVRPAMFDGGSAVYVRWPGDRPPVNVTAEVTFEYKGCPFTITTGTLTLAGGAYTIPKNELDALAVNLFKRISSFGPFDDVKNPFPGVWKGKVYLKEAGGKREKSSDLDITLKFNCSIADFPDMPVKVLDEPKTKAVTPK